MSSDTSKTLDNPVLVLELSLVVFPDSIFPGNKKRWCFYGEELALVLEKYNRYYRHQNHPALFTAQQPKTKQITRLSYRTAYADWRELIAERPELTEFRLHDLRHTFGTERAGLMRRSFEAPSKR